jgi:hypothetical protein
MNTRIPPQWMKGLDVARAIPTRLSKRSAAKSTVGMSIPPNLSMAGPAPRWSLFGAAVSLLILVFIGGCERKNQLTQPSDLPEVPPLEFEATGEDFLISALDEVQAIADWTNFSRTGSSRGLVPELPSRENKMVLSKTATDTVYIYGEVSNGYGTVVTERYTHPKGLLLITVRKSHGKENGRIVTQTKRYISYADLQSDNPQQTNVTELYGLAADTIVTHVLRNSTLETFTFRLPVITRVVNPQDGSIRITTRYGANGYVISEVRDGNDNLIQLRRNSGQADGSLVTRTEFPDSSWRQVRTVGQADGSILREVTSSLGPSSSIQQAAFCECLCGCGEDIRECKTCGCAQ